MFYDQIMMTVPKSTRFHVRTQMEIPLLVTYYENSENEWTEETQTENVTVCGAGFTLSHPVEPKRLVRLTLPMPRNLRLFDFGKKQYEVCALVRWLKLIETGTFEKTRLMVGVAFIGTTPASFLKDSKTYYDLLPVLQPKSFWRCREIPRQTGHYVRSLEERRPVVMPIMIRTINALGHVVETVQAETLNISESGMALITDMVFQIQSFVLVKPLDSNYSLLAAVRGFHRFDGDKIRLHLEFITGKWIF